MGHNMVRHTCVSRNLRPGKNPQFFTRQEMFPEIRRHSALGGRMYRRNTSRVQYFLTRDESVRDIVISVHRMPEIRENRGKNRVSQLELFRSVRATKERRFLIVDTQMLIH